MIVSHCDSCRGNDIKYNICLLEQKISDLGSIRKSIHDYGLKRNFSYDELWKLKTFRNILEQKLFNQAYTNFSTAYITAKVKEIANVQQYF